MATFGPYTFEQITDFIGLPVSAWPRDIYETYQKPIYTKNDRLKLCLFNFVNGFDNKNFLEYATANGALRDKAAIKDVEGITKVLEERKLHLHDWYSFSLVENKWVYLDERMKTN